MKLTNREKEELKLSIQSENVMDVVLGPYLKRDIDLGLLSEEDALRYLRSLWKLIENRRTTVNGRIIVGGLGRDNEEAGDLFPRLCLKVCRDTRYVEPQFTLRFSSRTPEDIMISRKQ